MRENHRKKNKKKHVNKENYLVIILIITILCKTKGKLTEAS